jgi:hypothetical protein
MCAFCYHNKTIKYLFFLWKFARSICSAIQIGSAVYPPRNIAYIFGNYLNVVHPRFTILFGWERFLLFCCLGYVEMTKFLIIKMFLFCRLFTGAPLRSVCDLLYNMRSIETLLRRCLHD